MLRLSSYCRIEAASANPTPVEGYPAANTDGDALPSPVPGGICAQSG
jgi:hypothetical protein